MENPGPYAAENLKTGEHGRFFDDYCNWNRISQFEKVIRESKVAEVAAKLMDSNTVQSWIGMIIIFGSLWAFWFHFLNGIRHLFWDLGYGFNLSTVWRSGWVVVLGSIILTI